MKNELVSPRMFPQSSLRRVITTSAECIALVNDA
jgi:hypothetical protein